ncbi:MAG: hypothetical protein JNK72_22565 [Myxococcales bacterium]|nr:hypothetical protein [Myxococcales bacterium]
MERRNAWMLWFSTLGLALGCGYDAPSPPRGFDAGPAAEVGLDDDVALGPLQAQYPSYDLTLTLPYQGPAQRFTLAVEPRATRLDVHFLIDTTGSFSGEVANLKLGLGNVILPGLRNRVPDLAMGVSRFADFPVGSFGNRTDRPYELLAPITVDYYRVGRAVLELDQPMLQIGGDGPEAWGESLWQVATGRGYASSVASIAPFVPPTGTDPATLPAGVGFRPGSARVVVLVTDAPTHSPDTYQAQVPNTHSLGEAIAALRGVNARVIGIASGDPARPQLEAVATQTGASVPVVGVACETGLRGGALRYPVNGRCPLVYDLNPDGSGLGQTIVDGIVRFLDSLAFLAVRGEVADDPRGFVQSVEAVSAVQPEGAEPPRREDRNSDGVFDTFADVPTRTRLTYAVNVQNTRVPEGEFPQVYFVTVRLMGDGVLAGQRTVRVIVPEGPKPDSGLDARVVDAVATP